MQWLVINVIMNNSSSSSSSSSSSADSTSSSENSSALIDIIYRNAQTTALTFAQLSKKFQVSIDINFNKFCTAVQAPAWLGAYDVFIIDNNSAGNNTGNTNSSANTSSRTYLGTSDTYNIFKFVDSRQTLFAVHKSADDTHTSAITNLYNRWPKDWISGSTLLLEFHDASDAIDAVICSVLSTSKHIFPDVHLAINSLITIDIDCYFRNAIKKTNYQLAF